MLPETPKPRSPLERLSLDKFKYHTYLENNYRAIGAGNTYFLPNNPNRLSLLIENVDVADIRVNIGTAYGVAQGLIVPANGGVFTMSFDDDGEVVGYNIIIYAPGAGTAIRIMEVILQ